MQALADEAAKLELVKTRHQELQVGCACTHMRNSSMLAVPLCC